MHLKKTEKVTKIRDSIKLQVKSCRLDRIVDSEVKAGRKTSQNEPMGYGPFPVSWVETKEEKMSRSLESDLIDSLKQVKASRREKYSGDKVQDDLCSNM